MRSRILAGMTASKLRREMSKARRDEIARRLTEAREDMGLTQADLAHRIGIYHSTVSRYENGARIPTARVWRSLSAQLGKPIGYLRATDWKEPDGEG